MTVIESARLDDGDRGKIARINIGVQFGCVPDVRLTSGLGTHELRLVLEWVAYVAVLVEGVGFGWIGDVEIPVFAEILERYVVSYKVVTDTLLAGGRDRVGRILRGERAVAVVTRVVVVDQVVVALHAVGAYGT